MSEGDRKSFNASFLGIGGGTDLSYEKFVENRKQYFEQHSYQRDSARAASYLSRGYSDAQLDAWSRCIGGASDASRLIVKATPLDTYGDVVRVSFLIQMPTGCEREIKLERNEMHGGQCTSNSVEKNRALPTNIKFVSGKPQIFRYRRNPGETLSIEVMTNLGPLDCQFRKYEPSAVITAPRKMTISAQAIGDVLPPYTYGDAAGPHAARPPWNNADNACQFDASVTPLIQNSAPGVFDLYISWDVGAHDYVRGQLSGMVNTWSGPPKPVKIGTLVEPSARAVALRSAGLESTHVAIAPWVKGKRTIDVAHPSDATVTKGDVVSVWDFNPETRAWNAILNDKLEVLVTSLADQ